MAIDLDAYRKQSRETWGQMAAGWEDRREWLMAITGRVNDWLVDKADAQPGQTILESAAGDGGPGFPRGGTGGGGGGGVSPPLHPGDGGGRPGQREHPR